MAFIFEQHISVNMLKDRDSGRLQCGDIGMKVAEEDLF